MGGSRSAGSKQAAKEGNDEAEPNRNDDHRGQRKIDARVTSFKANIAWEPPHPSQRPNIEKDPEHDQKDAGQNHESCKISQIVLRMAWQVSSMTLENRKI